MVQHETSDPLRVITRLQQAINDHDLDAFVACFAPDYRSEHPLYPGDSYTGRDRVRRQWVSAFREVPDINAELLRYAVAADQVWTEWYWRGTWRNGTPFGVRGVIIFGVEQQVLVWGRLYMLPDQPDVRPEGGSFIL